MPNASALLLASHALKAAAMARRSINDDIAETRAALGNRAIVLVGLMGAGKSSVGRRLAEKLGLPFVDADQEIEAAAGKTIPEIFADHGEEYFREGERRVIARLLEEGRQVLATGGGAYMDSGTRELARDRGISVWLKADLDLLLKRVNKRNDRPLLQKENPTVVLERLMKLRYPVYALADVIVESRDVQLGQMVNDVIRSMTLWPGMKALSDVD
jgi:shikimate kinase